MSELTNTFETVIRNAVWQSMVIFVVALVTARFAVRRPARVHIVLTLAFLAAIVAPLASEGVRRAGWGLLPPESTERTSSAIAEARVDSPAVNLSRELRASVELPRSAEAAPMMADVGPPANQPAGSQESTMVSNAALAVAPPVEPGFGVPSTSLLLAMGIAVWLCASSLLLWRLLRGVIGAWHVLRSATPCREPSVAVALIAARDRLHLNRVSIEVLESSAVRCPMIWCWARRPVLLLPVDAARNWSAATWTPVLCHELAHWKRRDHLAALVAEIVCCLMPWQVLAWWAKRRLEHASEQACDDWTVAVGHSAVDYAETLLGMVAQADPPLALAALRRRSGLAGRIHHILTQAVPHPRLGCAWVLAVLFVVATSIGITAICQRGVARAEAPVPPAADESKPKTDKPSDAAGDNKPAPAPAPISPGKPAAAMSKGAPVSTQTPGGTPIPPIGPEDANLGKPVVYRKQGRVLNEDGEPVAGADVYWEVRRRKVVDQSNWPAVDLAATAKTNEDGYFTLEATLMRSEIIYNGLVVRASGYGIHAPSMNDAFSLMPLEIHLEKSLPLEGTIYSPDGTPVANARVMLSGLLRGSDAKQGYNGHHVQLTADESQSEVPRPYWNRPVTTDEQGKFRMEDATPRRSVAVLAIEAPEYPLTNVSVRHPDSLLVNNGNTETPYRESGFTLVLETPYVVDGQFLDEKTGAPIVGAKMEVQPYNNNSNSSVTNIIRATSDSDGRYTMRVGSADLYFVKVFTPLGYPGAQTSISARQIRQFAGADRKLKYEVKFRQGLVLKGKVIDEASGEGVVDAQVHYVPEAGRKLGANSQFFPVKTAADGTFEITATDGQGFLLVDAPGNGFYRLAVTDKRVERYREGLYPHGLLELDLPGEGPTESFTIALKKGPELLVRALDPQGKPAKQLRAACAESAYEGFFNGDQVQGSTFCLEAAEVGRKYRVFLSSEDAKAGGVFEVEAPADGKPIDVTLEPWATVKGRYVYDGGTPAPEITNFTRFRLYPEQTPEGNAALNLPFYDNFSGHMHVKRVTDAEGNFELDGLIPGAFIYLNLNNEFKGGKRNYEVGILEPGEIKDVGELVIHANR